MSLLSSITTAVQQIGQRIYTSEPAQIIIGTYSPTFTTQQQPAPPISSQPQTIQTTQFQQTQQPRTIQTQNSSGPITQITEQQPQTTTDRIKTGLISITQPHAERFVEKHPELARTIHGTFQQAATYIRSGAGEDMGIPKPTAKPRTEFTLAPVARFAEDIATTWRGGVEKYRDPIEQIVGHGIASSYGPPGSAQLFAKHPAGPGQIAVGIAKAPAGLIEFAGIGVPIGVEYVVRHKEEFVETLPIAGGVMIGGTVKSFRERPGETAGEFAGMIFGPKVIGATTRILPRPQIKSSVKTPLGLTPGKATKFEAGHQLAKEFGTTELSPKPIDFTQVKYLPDESGLVVKEWIKTHPEQQPVIGGSTAARAHFPSARRGADIDILVQDPKIAGTELFKEIKGQLGSKRVRLTESPRWESSVVETRIGKSAEWHHAIDIHKTIPKESELSFGFKTQTPITIEGIKYQRPGELIQRKASSILEPTGAGTIGPKPHRIKDVLDFESQIADVIGHRRQQAESARFFSGRKQAKVKQLEEQLETYKMHSYMGPDPYMVVSSAKKYGEMPLLGRAGVAAGAVGSGYYPRSDLPSRLDYIPPSYSTPTQLGYDISPHPSPYTPLYPTPSPSVYLTPTTPYLTPSPPSYIPSYSTDPTPYSKPHPTPYPMPDSTPHIPYIPPPYTTPDPTPDPAPYPYTPPYTLAYSPPYTPGSTSHITPLPPPPTQKKPPTPDINNDDFVRRLRSSQRRVMGWDVTNPLPTYESLFR